MNDKSTPTQATSGTPEAIRKQFEQFVVPTYARFDLAFRRGQGSELFDVHGKRYLDLGGGIAVCCLGHAHPELAQAIADQAGQLIHVSNLYYTEQQGQLAESLTRRIAPGKVFFCNSGAEADEGLFKLARKFGHPEGRFEILTTELSFHGRTLAGIAATGQDKVKKGFEPMTPGFRQVPFNDLDAMKQAITPATAAILVEGIQGEGGLNPASADYLVGLRQLCDQSNLLLLIDGVQCGHYRTGCFQSYQRILEGVKEGTGFLPDAISMGKSLGGGFPMGAFWIREPHADLLGPGTHGTTFGGTPLACAVALKILEIIDRDHLAEHVRKLGDQIRQRLMGLCDQFPQHVTGVKGMGFMIGLELATDAPGLAGDGVAPSIAMVRKLHDAGLLTIPAGTRVVRLLPALNLTQADAEEGIAIIESTLKSL